MPILILSIDISAPRGVCFDLARDAAFHTESVRETGERIVAGKTSGLFELNDEVVFEGRHLGVKQQLGARIVEMEYPDYFVDAMTKGIFRSLRHRHDFVELSSGVTRMTDTMEWQSPLGIFGTVADILVVKSHLRQLLIKRGQRIKEAAEIQTSTL